MKPAIAALALVVVLQDAPSDPLTKHLDYLRHVESAEQALAKKDYEAAARACEVALALKPVDTSLPVKNLTGGAAAHALQAAAFAGLGKADAAFEALGKAASNGYTAIDFLKSEPSFAMLRKDSRWEEALKRFRDPAAADDWSGKTVKNPKFGNQLMQGRMINFPKAGEMAPDFDLAALGGGDRIRLSSYRGVKPVVVIFGSHT